MTDNHKAGLVLILGSLGGILTMAIHPTAGNSNLPVVSGIAHTLALGSVLLLFLGAPGVTAALNDSDRLALAGLVVFGFGCVAIMMAAAVSGFVIPDAMRLMERDVPAAAAQWRISIAAIFQINQACSRIYSVAAAGAITLWSICCLRQRRFGRSSAWFGVFTGPSIALLICVGHPRLNIHGMTLVMLSEAIWFTAVGVSLRRLDTRLQ